MPPHDAVIPSVAFLGQEGTFSHEACRRFLPSHRPLGCASFAAVIEAVRSGDADAGVLPVWNSGAGDTGAADLIERSGLRIESTHDLPVRMQLLALAGTTMETLSEVVGHRIALRQCAAFLGTLKVRQREASDSAAAARSIDRPRIAALGPEAAASLLGLDVIASDIQDRSDNVTRFAHIAC